MERRRLGPSDLEITPLGFGAWAVGGGGWWGGYGSQDDAESIAAIHRAVSAGINWIDTAPIYGLGHSEEVVGRALAGLAERPYVFTKCGLRFDPERNDVVVDLEPARIRAEIDESLARLDVDHVDLLHIHGPREAADDIGHIEAAWETLVEIRSAGKARHIGVSNFDASQLRRAQAIAPVTSLQPPYSLLDRAVADETLPFCEQEGIGVVVYSPLASGLLSGTMTTARAAELPEDDWRRDEPKFKEPDLSRNLAVAEGVKRVASWLGRAPGEVAIAWTLHNAAVTGAIVGFRKPAHVDSLVRAADLRLEGPVVAELEGLVQA